MFDNLELVISIVGRGARQEEHLQTSFVVCTAMAIRCHWPFSPDLGFTYNHIRSAATVAIELVEKAGSGANGLDAPLGAKRHQWRVHHFKPRAHARRVRT